MKEDTLEVYEKLKKAIDDKDKLAFSNYMKAFWIKGSRDIKAIEKQKNCNKEYHKKLQKRPFTFFCDRCHESL